jgi:hypothetical protein
MDQPLLSEFWRDIISLVGFILTVVGLVYAILQIRKTKSAAVAAAVAAKKALIESEQAFQRFAAAIAHRYVNEAKNHVSAKAWMLACLRLGDLADQVGQLAARDNEWRELTDQIREWERITSRHAQNDLTKFAARKWTDFLVQLQRKIDRSFGLLSSPAEGERNDS